MGEAGQWGRKAEVCMVFLRMAVIFAYIDEKPRHSLLPASGDGWRLGWWVAPRVVGGASGGQAVYHEDP